MVLGEAEVVVVVLPTSESLSWQYCRSRPEARAPACGHEEINAHGVLQGHCCVGGVDAMALTALCQ